MAEHVSCECPACGYDVMGVPDLRCPECGRDLRGWALDTSRSELAGAARGFDYLAGCIVLLYLNIAIGIAAFIVIAAAFFIDPILAGIAFLAYLFVVAWVGDRYGRSVSRESSRPYTIGKRGFWIVLALSLILVPLLLISLIMMF